MNELHIAMQNNYCFTINMLDDYMKRLEQLITPGCYNKNNFRDKLGSEYVSQPDNYYNSSNNNNPLTQQIQSEEGLVGDVKIEEYLDKMGIKDAGNILSEHKLKVYQKILDHPDENKKEQSVLSNRSRVYSLSPSRRMRHEAGALGLGSAEDNNNNDNNSSNTYKERIHQLNIQAMNYRHEIEMLKGRVTELKSQVAESDKTIQKLERQSDSDNKYLLKLESLLNGSGTNQSSGSTSNIHN